MFNELFFLVLQTTYNKAEYLLFNIIFQRGRGFHQGGGETPSDQRPAAQGLAAVRVPREFSACPNRRNNLSICHSPLNCDLLSRDASRVQALQGVTKLFTLICFVLNVLFD